MIQDDAESFTDFSLRTNIGRKNCVNLCDSLPYQDKKTEMKTLTMTFNTAKSEFLSLFLIKRMLQPNISSFGAFFISIYSICHCCLCLLLLLLLLMNVTLSQYLELLRSLLIKGIFPSNQFK